MRFSAKYSLLESTKNGFLSPKNLFIENLLTDQIKKELNKNIDKLDIQHKLTDIEESRILSLEIYNTSTIETVINKIKNLNIDENEKSSIIDLLNDKDFSNKKYNFNTKFYEYIENQNQKDFADLMENILDERITKSKLDKEDIKFLINDIFSFYEHKESLLKKLLNSIPIGMLKSATVYYYTANVYSFILNIKNYHI